MRSINVVLHQLESKQVLVSPVMCIEIAKPDHLSNFVLLRQVDIAGQEILIEGTLEEVTKNLHLRRSMPLMSFGISLSL